MFDSEIIYKHIDHAHLPVPIFCCVSIHKDLFTKPCFHIFVHKLYKMSGKTNP